MLNAPQILETHCEWRSEDVADNTQWIEQLGGADVALLVAVAQQTICRQPAPGGR